MKAIHRKRLLKLAQFLRDEIKDEEFNLNYFCFRKSCKTTACAVGSFPKCFPRQGFKYDFLSYPKNEFGVCNKDETRYGFQLAQDFFNLDRDDIYYLFDPDEYPRSHKSRKYVANRIERFVQRGRRHDSTSN